MEDKQIQPSVQPASEPLKIRTMQDDLRRAVVQPPGNTAPTILAKPLAPTPPALPKVPAAPQTLTAVRPAPEPPSHLPGVVVSPVPPKPVAPPLPKQSLPTPPSPPVIKPVLEPKPVFGEPIKKTPSQVIAQQTPVVAFSGSYKKLAIGGVILLLLAAGVYFFWPGQEPGPGLACQGEISPNCPPVSMISNLAQLTLGAENRDQIINEVKLKMADDPGPNAKLVALKKSADPDTYITFGEFIDLFGLNMSSQIKENTTNFNLLVHANPVESAADTASQSLAKKEIRFVLVLKQKDANKADEAMQAWEDEMVGDLEPLLLDTPGKPPLETFSTRVYNDGSFRYFSMPNYHLAINYVVSGDYLIIGTSRESIFYVYDLVTGKK